MESREPEGTSRRRFLAGTGATLLTFGLGCRESSDNDTKPNDDPKKHVPESFIRYPDGYIEGEVKPAINAAQPADDYVDRLMDAYSSRIQSAGEHKMHPQIPQHEYHLVDGFSHRQAQHRYSNTPLIHLEAHQMPQNLLEVAIRRDPKLFLPPRRLQREENERYISARTRQYWQELALQILIEAEKRTVGMISREENESFRAIKSGKQEAPAIRKTRKNDALGEHWEERKFTGPLAISEVIKRLRELAGPAIFHMYRCEDDFPLYFQVDTETRGLEAEDINAKIEQVITAARAELRRGIVEVLSDVDIMTQINKTAAIKQNFHAGVELKEEIDRINHIRETIETKEESARFLTFCKSMAATLGHADVDFQLLPTENALLNGSIAEYKAPGKKQRALISIAMSIYGTTEKYDLKTIKETLAHELAHHQMNKLRLKGDTAHGISHAVITDQYFEKLKSSSTTAQKPLEGGIPTPGIAAPPAGTR